MVDVLGPDEPDISDIRFQVREHHGVPIHKYRASDHPDHLDASKLTLVTEEGGLVHGDPVLVPALSGGYHLMTVQKEEDGSLTAHGDHFFAILEFGKDERNAWTCVGMINKRGLSKLRITT